MPPPQRTRSFLSLQTHKDSKHLFLNEFYLPFKGPPALAAQGPQDPNTLFRSLEFNQQAPGSRLTAGGLPPGGGCSAGTRGSITSGPSWWASTPHTRALRLCSGASRACPPSACRGLPPRGALRGHPAPCSPHLSRGCPLLCLLTRRTPPSGQAVWGPLHRGARPHTPGPPSPPGPAWAPRQHGPHPTFLQPETPAHACPQCRTELAPDAHHLQPPPAPATPSPGTLAPLLCPPAHLPTGPERTCLRPPRLCPFLPAPLLCQPRPTAPPGPCGRICPCQPRPCPCCALPA